MPLLIWTLMITCTLVSGADSRILEVTPNGSIVRELHDLYYDKYNEYLHDVKGLPDGNLLVATGKRVTEYNVTGGWGTDVRTVVRVWERGMSGLYGTVYDAERLANGNTLMTFFNSVVELDPSGNIVWVKPEHSQTLELNQTVDAERLANGNTLIVENHFPIPGGSSMSKLDRAMEIDPSGNIVWQVSGLWQPQDADRLPNGNTLIVEEEGPCGVSEFDPSGNLVWQIEPWVIWRPCDAERLPNGNTVVADYHARVIEFNATGHYLRTVWAGNEEHNRVMAVDVLANGDILVAVAVLEPLVPPSLFLLVTCLLVVGTKHTQA